MKAIIARIAERERQLDAMEENLLIGDLSIIPDAQLRRLQVDGIRGKPESEWSAYEHFVIRQYGRAG
jgi:hypothetical protein